MGHSQIIQVTQQLFHRPPFYPRLCAGMEVTKGGWRETKYMSALDQMHFHNPQITESGSGIAREGGTYRRQCEIKT